MGFDVGANITRWIKRIGIGIALFVGSLLGFFLVYVLISEAKAGNCYSWQALTCRDNTQVVLQQDRQIVGYLTHQSDGSIRILDKNRRIRGYIELDGGILDVHRRENLQIEGLPDRYSPIPR